MTTLLLCLIISVISPTLPLSWPDMTFTVSPSFTCILCSTGRLFGLHFFRSHRLSCRSNENEDPFYTQQISLAWKMEVELLDTIITLQVTWNVHSRVTLNIFGL
uniref:Putative ovule protein n=1 Tax=Solanum chacoense TaxID=4108 RepID=A0A0V0H7G9_SOLCH